MLEAVPTGSELLVLLIHLRMPRKGMDNDRNVYNIDMFNCLSFTC